MLYLNMKDVEINEQKNSWIIKTRSICYSVTSLNSLYSLLITLGYLELMDQRLATYFIKRIYYHYKIKEKNSLKQENHIFEYQEVVNV